jgi:diguanylate cyclase (GGDEF)-like protein
MISAGRELRREKDALVLANSGLQTSQEDLRMSNEELKERKRQLLEARALEARDGLTGIFNRRSFQERVREEIERADMTVGNVGLIMLDIDGFKQINDELGHLEGDRILQEVAGAIASVVPSETTYRYGGDEFAILLPGIDDAAADQLRPS